MAEANSKSKFDNDLGCSINGAIKTASLPNSKETSRTKIAAEADIPNHILIDKKSARRHKFGQTLTHKFKAIASKVFSAKKSTHSTDNGEVSKNKAEFAKQPPEDAKAVEALSTQSSHLSNLIERDTASEASYVESLVDVADEVVDKVLSCKMDAAAAETDRPIDADDDVLMLLSGHVLKVNHVNPVPTTFHSSADLTDPLCDPTKPIQISYDDVAAAAAVVSSNLVRTSCTRCIAAENYGFDLYFKKEFELYTGSFNERGAYYALVSLSEEQKKRGVISASWGDQAQVHNLVIYWLEAKTITRPGTSLPPIGITASISTRTADIMQGLSYNGWKLNIPVTVVMPRRTPIQKVQKCRSFNARVIVEGNDFDEAQTTAMEVGNREGLVYINGYDHPHVIAGQGTMALEILEQVPNPDAVVMPVGGGSMISGVSAVFKMLSPNTKIIGVESETCPSFTHAILKNGPVFTPPKNSLADVLAVPKVGYNAFVTAVPCIDRMVVVDEEWIAMAILRLVEEEKCVVDGAGASPMAALLAGHLDDLLGKKVVLVLSGGNIDTTVIGRVLERGLANEGRLVKFDVHVDDEHNGINQLCELLKKVGVEIRDISHEHVWLNDTCILKLKVVCETCHWPHSMALKEALEKEYAHVEFSKKPLTLHSKTPK